MKLGSLFSGGKDSTFAIYMAKEQGHDVACLLTIIPKSDESNLLHFPNMKWTKLQSESLQIPQLVVSSDSDETSSELLALETLLYNAREQFQIEGLVHGGIKSKFQKEKFEFICAKVGLTAISPLWNSDPEKYMHDLLASDFTFVITSVSSDGLDDTWLGKSISTYDLENLQDLSCKFGFNLNFEGGEAETFVIDCPLFSNSIRINQSKTTWDGYRGRFEILEAELEFNA
ncbi:diphthine--ammonia ligase [Nitrosopumilus sp.]|uniref:diphthine--ammonia ligase n=1 Tax=Nitrosopumilus sp. TaxID=2024843 RepID=UPI00292E5BD8|nr:diphthine--ammonia ligase [Nitrosopumilus sp.]